MTNKHTISSVIQQWGTIHADYFTRQRERKIDTILNESKSQQIEDLKKQLSDLRRDNLNAWETYGSEICAGELIRQEEELENKIKQLSNDNIN